MAASYNHLALTTLLLTIKLIFPSLHPVEAQNTNFSFLSFGTPEHFLMVQDVDHYPETSSFLLNSKAASTLTSSCGKLMYNETVRMKDSTTGAVASFHTAFSFQIIGPDNFASDFGYIHADGMAFTFTRANDLQAGQNPGGTLCLIQAANNGHSSNRMFAIEFDTYPNSWYNDPSDSHIGVDINSMNSSWTYNLCGGNVFNCSSLCNGGFFTAWIDYDSALNSLQVFFTNGSLYNNTAKPRKPVIMVTLPLSDLLDDSMYVGFSSSTGRWSEVHQIQSWMFTSFGVPERVTNNVTAHDSSSHGSSKVGVIAGASAGGVAVLLLVGLFIARYRWGATSRLQHDKFNLVGQNLVPRMFTYKELSKATKNFSRSELLGSGAFGAVYKATLPSGALVAVKRMRHESKHGEESFQAEAASLSQIRHRNLVQLRGWCSEQEQMFLVYDYMCNGSLDEWLFHSNSGAALPLTLRYSVLTGVAAALAYLHEECAQCVLHRDIKSSNVLLDGELNAYLGDFGLARLIDHRKMEKTTMMAGTLGYMAPEMPHTGKATKESDVYSFGVLVLEVMCGVRPLEMGDGERGDGVLVDRVWRAHEAGDVLQVMDLRLVTISLSGTYDEAYASIPIHGAAEDRKMILNLLNLGLLCCNPNPEDRPTTRMVSQLLQSAENMDMIMPVLPVCKPHARYSRPGFSQFGIVPSSDHSYALSRVVSVEGSPQSTAPLSGVSNGEPHAVNIQTSFVASSAIFEGR